MGNQLQKDTPFDQYSRQFQVAAIVNDLRDAGKSFKILDVGGYKGRTAEFFPKDEVIVLDVFDVEENNYVKGDGTKLPFKDGSFDFVLNFDVLEHIPVKGRHLFVDECVRVASRGAIFSAPHKTPENEKAEESLNELHKTLHGKEHRWLKEHIDYTLPDYVDIEQFINKKGLYTVKFPSNDTLLWTLMQGIIFLNSKFPMAAPKLIEINEHYNEHYPYDGGDDLSNTYRLILCAMKNQSDSKKLQAHFAKKNKPLNLSQKLSLVTEMHEYHSLLLTKMTEENQNLRTMHEHEAGRANQLHDNSVELWKKINELEDKRTIQRIKRQAAHLLKSESHKKNHTEK